MVVFYWRMNKSAESVSFSINKKMQTFLTNHFYQQWGFLLDKFSYSVRLNNDDKK